MWDWEDGVDGQKSSFVDDVGNDNVRGGGKEEDASEVSNTNKSKGDCREEEVDGFLHDEGVHEKVKSHQEDNKWLDKFLGQVGDIIVLLALPQKDAHVHKADAYQEQRDGNPKGLHNIQLKLFTV